MTREIRLLFILLKQLLMIGAYTQSTLFSHSCMYRALVKEKAAYIVRHLVKIIEKRSNDKYKAKAMLVTSSRKHILWYKEELTILIDTLPLHQRFDVVYAF